MAGRRVPPTSVVIPSPASIARMIGMRSVAVGLRRRKRADRVEADRGAADVLLAERVEARRPLVGRQRVERRDLLGRQLGAGLRVADRERAFDPVDAVEPGQLAL